MLTPWWVWKPSVGVDGKRGGGADSSLGLWEESFDGHPDSKPDGPTSVGMDVFFPGGFHVFWSHFCCGEGGGLLLICWGKY